jgi:signal transduction histidine kinase
MRPHRRLKVRAALAFALFGAAVSLLLSIGLYFSAHGLGQRLMDETLRAELEDYMARRQRNPESLPPATASLIGYLVAAGEPAPHVPPAIAALAPGRHELALDGIPYRIAVADQAGTRYYLLFNEQRQRQREQEFLIYLAAGVLIMTLLSAAGGLWLARRVVEPVTALARAVREAEPDSRQLDLSAHFSRDELGELARALHRYQTRLNEFIEREQAFTADVSHELRTPLAVITGAVEILEADANLSPPHRDRIRRIGRAARDMADMTAALLVMAREEASDAGESSCSVAEVLNECVDKHRHLLDAKMTSLEVNIHARPQLPARAALLAIVINNLIRNAFAYTEQGVVTLTLETDRLVVSDTGSGICNTDLERVFERHYRGSASQGSGIGLSLVKRLCHRHGWDIQIDSREGEGTTAQLVFPTHAP